MVNDVSNNVYIADFLLGTVSAPSDFGSLLKRRCLVKWNGAQYPVYHSYTWTRIYDFTTSPPTAIRSFNQNYQSLNIQAKYEEKTVIMSEAGTNIFQVLGLFNGFSVQRIFRFA
jgi:hypothetical protein